MKILAWIVVALVVVAWFLGPQLLYVVDETKLAIVTRFGEPVGSVTSPGIYLRTPLIDKVTYFEKRLLVFDAPPDSLLTKDKKRLIIDVYARGRIVDPLVFFKTVTTESRAAARAIDIVASELRREIALDDQAEIIRDNRELIMNRVRDAARPKLVEFGIDLVDVRIKRADFPTTIETSVYERMKAERKRIADRERAEGAEADLEKRAQVDRRAIQIRSAAQRDADIIRGCGEARAIGIFAEALEQDPEFYTFQRSLEAYKKYLSQNTTVVGSAEDLGQMFEQIRQAVVKAAKAPPLAANGTDAPTDGEGFESRCEQFQAEFASRKFLSSELDTDRIDLNLMSLENVDWGDSSLGCPEEGQVYAQVIAPGYSLIFEHEGGTHEVHANQDGSVVVRCPVEP